VHIQEVVVARPSGDRGLQDEITEAEKATAASLEAVDINLGGGSLDGSFKPGFSVQLAGESVTAEAVTRAAQLRTLVCLSLEGPRVTDDVLSGLSGHTYLASLTLKSGAFSEAGLLSLRGCSSLKWLSIKGTHVSQKAVGELETLLPQCEITVETAK